MEIKQRRSFFSLISDFCINFVSPVSIVYPLEERKLNKLGISSTHIKSLVQLAQSMFVMASKQLFDGQQDDGSLNGDSFGAFICLTCCDSGPIGLVLTVNIFL
jgi:hypothetical protein